MEWMPEMEENQKSGWDEFVNSVKFIILFIIYIIIVYLILDFFIFNLLW